MKLKYVGVDNITVYGHGGANCICPPENDYRVVEAQIEIAISELEALDVGLMDGISEVVVEDDALVDGKLLISISITGSKPIRVVGGVYETISRWKK